MNWRLWRHLRSNAVGFAVLAEIDHPDGQVNVWSGTSTLPYDGVGADNGLDGPKEWLGVGHIAGVSGLETTAELLVSEIRMVLTNIPADALFDMSVNVKGRSGTLWWAGIDAEGKVVPDPIVLAIVKLDYITAPTTDDGESFLEVIGQNGFWVLQRPADISWTPEEQAKRFPGDTGFDFVNDLVSREVAWTQAEP